MAASLGQESQVGLCSRSDTWSSGSEEEEAFLDASQEALDTAMGIYAMPGSSQACFLQCDKAVEKAPFGPGCSFKLCGQLWKNTQAQDLL